RHTIWPRDWSSDVCSSDLDAWAHPDRSSQAHLADFAVLLARTDPDVPKHRGISYFIFDMHAPGVEVRPLKQITGNAEFNEVFFTDVKVPAENLIGEEGQGWQLAQTTLGY